MDSCFDPVGSTNSSRSFDPGDPSGSMDPEAGGTAGDGLAASSGPGGERPRRKLDVADVIALIILAVLVYLYFALASSPTPAPRVGGPAGIAIEATRTAPPCTDQIQSAGLGGAE